VKPCVFCQIVEGEAPAKFLRRWAGVLVIEPLNPVTPGHTLVIPTRHVIDASDNPLVAARTMRFASLYARQIRQQGQCPAVNIITSCGAEATQTVFHLHVHVVPRRADDGLHLPWTVAPPTPLRVAGGPGLT
jgi:histidine triad (HIT) family protein